MQGCPGKFEHYLCESLQVKFPANDVYLSSPPAGRGRGQGEGGRPSGFAAPPTSPSRFAGPSLSPLKGGEGLLQTG